MAKIGILTSLLILVFAIMEKTALLFSIGFSLLLLTTIKEFIPRKIKSSLQRLLVAFQIVAIERYRNQHQPALLQAEDLLFRFASRTKTLLSSNYILTKEGRIRAQRVVSENEEREELFKQFCELLSSKGIELSDECIRIYINFFIRKRRIEQLKYKLLSHFENKPTLNGLIKVYAEEELHMENTSSELEYWNRPTLLNIIEEDYDKEEIKELFPKWFSNKTEQLNASISFFQEEYYRQLRILQLEEWLLGSPEEKVISLTHFDQHVDQFTEFRMGVVYLLEKIGYKITLPIQENGIDLIIERSEARYGVILKPLLENQSVTTHTIHEVHTIRTLAELQNIMVITNRSFTPTAIELANKLGIISIHRDHLADWLSKNVNPYQQQLGS